MYRLEPWTRAIDLVERGDHQLLIGTTPAGSPKLKLSTPIGVDRTCFYVPSDSPWRYKRPDDLKSMRVGVVQDYSYDAGGAIDKLIAGYRKARDPRLELAYGDNALNSNFRKLAGGRMDVVIENENVARYTLRQMNLSDRIIGVGCVTHYLGTLHIGFSPKLQNAPAIAAQIEQGIAEMRRSGELERILASYGLQDWQTSLAGKSQK
jgi:polar amino acid transport system substrate-binding protein